MKDEEWKIENGIVMKKGRIYMPEEELRGGDNTITPQHPSRRAQREMEDDRVGCQE